MTVRDHMRVRIKAGMANKAMRVTMELVEYYKIKVPSLPDWSNCKKEELLLLQDDGIWYSTHLNKTLDEVNLYGEYTSNCRIDGEAIAAGNNEAKIGDQLKNIRIYLGECSISIRMALHPRSTMRHGGF